MFSRLKNQLWFYIWGHISTASPFLTRLWQERRLRRLLSHHYKNNPFYRRIIGQEGITQSDIANFRLQNLAKTPIMSKNKFSGRNLRECIAQNIHPRRFRERSTSGSTGNPFKFWVDLKYWNQAKWLYSKVWRNQGFERDARLVIIQVILEKNVFSNRLYVPGLEIYDNAKREEIISQILNFQADGIMSFPSFLIELCRLLNRSTFQIKKPLFKIILTSGETLTDADRKFIEDTLGGKVFDRYGISEFFCIGQECQNHNGFHLNSESYILEIVGESGLPAPAGAEGRVVVTNLDNEIVPFIRYDTGDLGHIVAKRCACGSSSTLFKINGRRPRPQIWEIKGRRINPFLFYEVFLDQSENVSHYQVVRKSDNSIKIMVVPAAKFKPDVLEDLIVKIRKAAGINDLEIKFEIADSIAPAATGKRQDFVDETAA